MCAHCSSPPTVPLAINNFPPDVFGCIAKRLMFTDRLSFLSCCRAAREYHLSTPSGLFPDLTFVLRHPDKVGQLAAWLADNKRHLGTVRLLLATAESKVEAMTLLVLGALSGSSVHTLRISTDKGEVQVDSWLRMLGQLQSLGISAKKVWLGSGLRDLPVPKLTLTSFGPPIVFPSGALSPLLQALSVQRFDAASLGEALKAAGPLCHLRALSLTQPTKCWASGEHWDMLAAYTQLTSLDLVEWSLQEVPGQLGALTALQELSLKGNDLEDNVAEASLGVLASLTKLSKLCQASCNLEAVPPSIWALPALQVLDITESCITELPPLTASSNLTSLALDLDLVVSFPEALTVLSALRTLAVHEPADDYSGYNGISSSQVGKVLKSLGQLPSFELLIADVVCGDPNPFKAARDLLQQLDALSFIQFTIFPF